MRQYLLGTCQLDDEAKGSSSLASCSQLRRSTMTCDSASSSSVTQQAVDDGGESIHDIRLACSPDEPTSQNLPLRLLGNYDRSPRPSRFKSASERQHRPRIPSRLMRDSSPKQQRRSSSSGIGSNRPQGSSDQHQLWSPAMVGSLYVFEGDKVPALMEFFTSASSPDFCEIHHWLSAWFTSNEGQNPMDPQFVPLVFHVTDLSNGIAQPGNAPTGNDKFTQRRLAYEKLWELDGTHSEERYSGFGTCLVINGECVNKEETFCRQEAGMAVAVRSRSPGALKILLADERTALITFQPLPQCRHMIGQLVANVAIVGCGGPCSARGHDPSGCPTHHSTVLDTAQVQLEKREDNAYHVAGLSMPRPGEANFRLPPGIVSYGLVVWVTHGYVDSTPIAVGYCGLSPP